MNQVLKTVNHVPPGGWAIDEPEGFELNATSESELVQMLMRHRKAKGVPISQPEAKAIIHSQICERWPTGCQKDPRAPNIGVLSWKAMAARFVSAVGNFARGGFQTVEPGVAEDRAFICLSCPHNRPSHIARAAGGDCPTCRKNSLNNIADAVAKVTKKLLASGAKTSHDSRLRACGLCGCDLKTMVHFPIEALGVTAEESKIITTQAPWCWKVA